jgi:hypothetical protein
MSRRNVKAVEDADVVILLKKAGGILIGVTNIPEYNLWVETRNNVYGQTLNPYNTTRTVGGSSGGEVRRTECSKNLINLTLGFSKYHLTRISNVFYCGWVLGYLMLLYHLQISPEYYDK